MGHYIELPKLVHPDFAFPHRKPVGPVEIDNENRLRKAPIGLYALNGKVLNLINNKISAYASKAEFVSVGGNRGLAFDGVSGSFIDLGETLSTGGGKWSIVSGFDSTTASGYVFCARSGANRQWALYSDNGKIGANVWASTSRSTTTDTGYKVSGISNNNNTGNCQFYYNGRPDGTGTVSTASGSLVNAALGGRLDNISLFTGTVYFALFFDYELTAAEHKILGESYYSALHELLTPAIPLTYFIPSAGGGTTINASLESISLTENASTVSLDKSITAALESILLTEYQSNTDLDKTVNASVESISLSGLSASVQANIDTDISAAQEVIQVNELSASISLGSGISAVLESITLAELSSSITLDKNISAGIESISVSENAAQITLGSNVAGVLEGITLTEHQAGVVLDVAVNASQEAITINQLAAMIGLATDINAVKENITLTESGATLTLDTSISGATEQISLTTFNFTLTSSISTPNQPGLEYTIPISKMGYTIPVSKIHFTFREED